MDKEKQRLANSTSEKILGDLGFVDNLDESKLSRENEIKNILSREKAINSFRLIAKKSAIVGQEFCVIAYFLTNEISKEGSHGMWFLVGVYNRAELAIKEAEKIIKDTGLRSIYAMKTCDWQEINDKFEPDRIKLVPVGRDEKLKKQHLKEYEDKVNEFKKEEEIAKEIDEEQERELQPDQIEYYNRQWFLAIKNKAMVENLKIKLNEVSKSLDTRIENIKKVYQENPQFEDQWLNVLGEKLPKRGEQHILDALIKGHEEMLPSILPQAIKKPTNK